MMRKLFQKKLFSRLYRFRLVRLRNLACFFLLVASVLFLFLNIFITRTMSKHVYRNLDALPTNDVGLLLGTVKLIEGKYLNGFFVYRVEAAAQLYHAGKIKHILVSGDNHKVGYDEPSDMRQALVSHGVPSSAITCDYAGFRTLDSVLRAKKIFGLSHMTVISQEYHNYRALFLARHFGIEAVAWCARNVSGVGTKPWYMREYLARAKAVLDLYVLRKKPRFLGPREPIQVGAG